MGEKQWCVYILCCSDKTLYTGMTNDITNRVKQHNEKNGAKYTKGRTPVELVYLSPCGDKSEALKTEIKIKKMSRQEKLALIGKALN